MTQNLELGARGEDLAADYLTDHGLVVLARNWRCRYGEIDLVGLDKQARCLVFVEVKTRSGDRYGMPAEAVSSTKQARIRRLAAQWLSENRNAWLPVRFDVVAIIARRGYLPIIEHYPGAF